MKIFHIQKRYLIIFFTVVMSALMYSCGGSRRIENYDFLSMMADERPDSMKPVYMTGTVPIDSADPNKLAFDIFRIEMHDFKDHYPRALKIYARVYDSSGRFVTNMADPNLKDTNANYWTGINENFYLDKIKYDSTKIKNYTVREYGDHDSIPYNIALTVDYSGSMSALMQVLYEGQALFVSLKSPYDKIALSTFNRDYDLKVPLMKDTGKIMSLYRSKYTQGIGIYSAVNKAIMNSMDVLLNSPDDVPKILVVFTDGDDNFSKIKLADLAVKAMDNEIRIFTIAFGYSKTKQLKYLAEKTGGKYYKAYTKEELINVFRDLYMSLKYYYLIEYKPPVFYGKHQVLADLTVPGRTDVLQAEGEYDTSPFDIFDVASNNNPFNNYFNDKGANDFYDRGDKGSGNGDEYLADAGLTDKDRNKDYNSGNKNNNAANDNNGANDGFDKGDKNKGNRGGNMNDGGLTDNGNYNSGNNNNAAKDNNGANDAYDKGDKNKGNRGGNMNDGGLTDTTGKKNNGYNNGNNNNLASNDNNGANDNYDNGDKNKGNRGGNMNDGGLTDTSGNKNNGNNNGFNNGNNNNLASNDNNGANDNYDNGDKNKGNRGGNMNDGGLTDTSGNKNNGFNNGNNNNNAANDNNGANDNYDNGDKNKGNRGGNMNDGGLTDNDLNGNNDKLFSLDEGGSLQFELPILFDFDKAAIRPESDYIIDQIAVAMKKNPRLKLEIQGHTDSVGTFEYNMKLSKKRAEVVKEALVRRGIAPSRLVAVGFGERMPAVPNDSEKAMALNRRTIFRVLDK